MKDPLENRIRKNGGEPIVARSMSPSSLHDHIND
jgi:hypothetical protein